MAKILRPHGYPGIIQILCHCGLFNTWTEHSAPSYRCRRCGARWLVIQ